jgi:tetratricopeptide (TPR) repeat protein
LLAWAQDDYGAAQALLENSLALMQPDEQTLTRAHALGLLGLVHLYRLELEAAGPAFDESLSLFRALDARWGVAISLIRLAIVAHRRGEWARADPLNEEALALYRELENPLGIAIALANTAEVALSQNDWRRAARYYREALAIQRSTGSHWYVSLTLIGIAGVAVARGQMREAAWLLGVSEAMLALVNGRIPAIDRLTYERNVASARAHLGEAEFAAAWAEGQGMAASDWEKLVVDVLQQNT